MNTDDAMPDAYNARTRELFSAPEHALLEAAAYSAVSDVSESARGARLQLMVCVADGCIRDCHFRARACPHLIAACERWCRAMEGRSIAALQSFELAEYLDDLEVPVEKTGRILMLEDAIREIARQLQT